MNASLEARAAIKPLSHNTPQSIKGKNVEHSSGRGASITPGRLSENSSHLSLNESDNNTLPISNVTTPEAFKKSANLSTIAISRNSKTNGAHPLAENRSGNHGANNSSIPSTFKNLTTSGQIRAGSDNLSLEKELKNSTANESLIEFSTNSPNADTVAAITDSPPIRGRNDSTNRTFHSNSTDEPATKESNDVAQTTPKNEATIGTVPINSSQEIFINQSKEDPGEFTETGFNATGEPTKNDTESGGLFLHQSTASPEIPLQPSNPGQSVTVYSSSSSFERSHHNESFTQIITPGANRSSVVKTYRKPELRINRPLGSG